MTKKGVLLVVSGPSGAGKGTVIRDAMERDKSFYYSVSATTRAPRAGEIDRVNYHFVTRERFEEFIRDGAVVEHTEYSQNYYGTLRSETEGKCDDGFNVILEIEVDGASQIKKKFPEAVSVMILPPDFKTLEKRLRSRGTNTEEDIKRRLDRAREEMKFYGDYDYLIVNYDNEVRAAADELISIVKCEHMRTLRNPDFPAEFFNLNNN